MSLPLLLRQDRALVALDIVLDVAFHVGRGTDVTGAGDIADRLGAVRRGIEPMLQSLTRADILDSLRGPRGGYRLARPAAGITAREIVMAVTEEEPTAAPASRLALAVTRPFWQELDASLWERLDALTLAEMLRRAAAAGLRRPVSEPLSFEI